MENLVRIMGLIIVILLFAKWTTKDPIRLKEILVGQVLFQSVYVIALIFTDHPIFAALWLFFTVLDIRELINKNKNKKRF